MRILPKNLMKPLTSLGNRSSFYTSKRRHIFRTDSTAENNDSNQRLLLRRFRWIGLDEDRIFSGCPLENFTSSTKLSSLITAGFNSPENISYFCSTSSNFFSLLSPDEPLKAINFPHFSNPKLNSYAFTGSCGGVVCFDNNYEGAVFWNPTTKELKCLPKSDLGRPDPDPDTDTDPAEAHPLTITIYTFNSGFGFDHKSKDYKLVRWVSFWFEDEDCRLQHRYEMVELYSLKSDSWKRIPSPRGGSGDRRASASVNGNFYLTIGWCDPAEIQRFDFSTEQFSYIPFPKTTKRVGTTHYHRLFDVGGRLGVVIYQLEGSNKSFELWKWNADANMWCPVFCDRIADADRPLGFSNNGRFLFLRGEADRQLRMYDIDTSEVKKLGIYCHPRALELDVIPYSESTFPLNGATKAKGGVLDH